MRAEEVHKMSSDELGVAEQKLRKELFELRCKAVTEELENPREIRNLRRDIARVKTEKVMRSTKKDQD